MIQNKVNIDLKVKPSLLLFINLDAINWCVFRVISRNIWLRHKFIDILVNSTDDRVQDNGFIMDAEW